MGAMLWFKLRKRAAQLTPDSNISLAENPSPTLEGAVDGSHTPEGAVDGSHTPT